MSAADTLSVSRRQFLAGCAGCAAAAATPAMAETPGVESGPSSLGSRGEISPEGRASIAEVDQRFAQQRPPMQRTVRAVEDLGLDPSGGTPINGALESALSGMSNTRIVFPSSGTFVISEQITAHLDGPIELVGNGCSFVLPPNVKTETFNFVCQGGTLLRDFVIDQSAQGAVQGLTVQAESGVVQMNNVTIKGYAPASPGVGATGDGSNAVGGMFSPIARTQDSVVRATNFTAVGGTAAGTHDEADLPDSALENRLGSPLGIWVGQTNLGTVQMVNPTLSGWSNILFDQCLVTGSSSAAVMECHDRPQSRIQRTCITTPNAGPEDIEGAQIRTDGGRVVVWDVEGDDGELATWPTEQLDTINVFGGVNFSTPFVARANKHGIVLNYFTKYGKYRGSFVPERNTIAEVRRAQYALPEDRELAIARAMIAAKIRNARTLLARKGVRGTDILKDLGIRAESVRNKDELRGAEGEAAERYFARLDETLASGWTFEKRTKRPPEDHINSLLSLTYVMMKNEVLSALRQYNLDPFLGILHADRHGRPSLALDLQEEFRPIFCDAFVTRLVNRGTLTHGDFRKNNRLTEDAFKTYLSKFDDYMKEEFTHPYFEYRVSRRKSVRQQAILLRKAITGELDDYHALAFKR